MRRLSFIRSSCSEESSCVAGWHAVRARRDLTERQSVPPLRLRFAACADFTTNILNSARALGAATSVLRVQ
jgi:hypothetical protein